MATTVTTDAVRKLLDWFFRQTKDADGCLYALLDAAREKRIPKQLHEIQAEFVSLYRGEPEVTLADVAPYLVRIGENSKVLEWILGSGWGRSWGLFAISAADLDGLRRHFRRFLLVRDPDGKELYFRFYDPRVLRVYLPTCTGPETKRFLGPIHAFLMESEDAKSIYRFDREPLQTFPLLAMGIRTTAD